jgi:hypothetical protein
LTAAKEHCSWRPDRDYELQTPPEQVKSPQQSAVVVHVAPTPPQQVLVLAVALLAMAQSRFVSLVQHCRFVWHATPERSGSQTGHFFFFFFFFASASPLERAKPAAATADAAPAASAAVNAPRRVLAS